MTTTKKNASGRDEIKPATEADTKTVVTESDTGDIVRLITNAVEYINNYSGDDPLETAMAVGDYVFDKFYHNDIDDAMSKNLSKHDCYMKLLQSPYLKVRREVLNQMVQLSIQEHYLREIFGIAKVNLLTYELRLQILSYNKNLKLDMAKQCIDIAISTNVFTENYTKTKPKPDSINKHYIDLFIRDIVSKYSERDFSKVSNSKIEKMQEEIDEILLEIENTKTQLIEIKNKLETKYQQKVKPAGRTKKPAL